MVSQQIGHSEVQLPEQPIGQIRRHLPNPFQNVVQIRLRDPGLRGQASFGNEPVADAPAYFQPRKMQQVGKPWFQTIPPRNIVPLYVRLYKNIVTLIYFNSRPRIAAKWLFINHFCRSLPDGTKRFESAILTVFNSDLVSLHGSTPGNPLERRVSTDRVRGTPNGVVRTKNSIIHRKAVINQNGLESI